MDFQTIRYEPGTVARVVLNRPERLNAQSWLLLEEMEAAFGLAVADSACRVIVLSGEGRSFSAGHDLDSPEHLSDKYERYGHLDRFGTTERYRDLYVDCHLRWRDLTKPTIAMVHGYCIFGGWMIAAAMDVVFASDDAMLVPVYGDYFTLPWDIGPRRAKEILFGNRFLTAAQACELGFVNRVFPRADLAAEVLKYAQRVGENEPELNRTIKFAVNHVQDTMGFTTSVRAFSPKMNDRDPQIAPIEFTSDHEVAAAQRPFRDQVRRVVQYAREDGLLPTKGRSQ